MRSFLLLVLATSALMAQAPKLHVTMISLPVKDPAISIKFYGETLGLPMVGQPGEVTFFRAGDVTFVLRASKNPTPGSAEIIFPVESVARAHRELEARGCHFIATPHEVTPEMWAATFTDPDGYNLTVLGSN